MRYTIITAILIFISAVLMAQQEEKAITDIAIFAESYKSGSDGNVVVNHDVAVASLLDKYILLCSKRKAYPGWRVQIFLSSDRNAHTKAEQTKRVFQVRYPNYGVYMGYKAPFFRVRVGDFRTKNEAIKFKNTIQKQFPNCWVVESQIGLPSLDKE